MGIVQKVAWAEMRQLEILFKNIVRDAMGIAVFIIINELRNTTINGVAFKFHVHFSHVTQQSTLSGIFRNRYK